MKSNSSLCNCVIILCINVSNRKLLLFSDFLRLNITVDNNKNNVNIKGNNFDLGDVHMYKKGLILFL